MKIFNHFRSMPNKKESGGGFDKTTDFKWFGIGLLVFVLIWAMPTPESMTSKARVLFEKDVPSINKLSTMPPKTVKNFIKKSYPDFYKKIKNISHEDKNKEYEEIKNYIIEYKK